MPLTDAVPSSAFDVLERNVQDADKFVNQETGTFTNRVGKVIKPIPVIESQAIEYIKKTNWNPVGLFSDGVTFEKISDFAIDDYGVQWIYTGTLPFTAIAGTIPSPPSYQSVKVSSLQQLANLTEPSDLAQRHRIKTTVAEISTGVFKDEDLLEVSDRYNAPFTVKSTGVINGHNIIDAGSGKVATLEVNGVANVMHFGAKGIGNAYDDSPHFRAAAAYLHANGGGKILVPKPSVHYSYKSTVLTTTGKKACLIIPEPMAYYGDPISIIGEVPLTPIRGEIPLADGFAVIYFEGFSQYKQLKNLDVWGGPDSATKLFDHVLYGADNFHALMKIDDCRFYVCVEDCVRLASYVCDFTKVQTSYSKKGIKIAGPNDDINSPMTSITLDSCYTLNHSENGYWFGNTTYCTFNSCAADHIEGYAYYFQVARGTTINGCGAESSYGILEATVFQGLTINGLMTLSIGLGAPTPYDLIKLSGGTAASISGIHNQNPQTSGIRKVLHVGNGFNTECVTILDRSISPDQVSYVPNPTFDYPVKYVTFDKSNSDYTWNITNAGSLIDTLDSFKNLEINHTYTLQFPNGDMALGANLFALSADTRGTGKVIFKGGINSRLVLIGEDRLSFGDTAETLNVFIDNMDIHMQGLTGAGRGLTIESGNMSLINGANITSSASYEWVATSYAKINFDSTSQSLTPVFLASDRVEVTISPLVSAPASLHYPLRTTVMKETPDSANIGWTKGSSSWIAF